MRKPSNLRMLIAFIVFVVVGIGLAFSTGLGTPSSFGWDAIATACPVGIIETFLAKWVVTPHGLICLITAVILILVLGKCFCGWLCPVPLLRRAFGGKKKADKECSDLKDVCSCGCTSCKFATGTKGGHCPGKPALAVDEGSEKASKGLKTRIKNGPFDSRHAVLIGALASTAIFGFPVFCLICPVGLSIATFIGLWRLVRLNETTWSLIIFPLILIVEIFVMRKWCHRFCPLSAAISLISKSNRTLRPTVDASKCLRESAGTDCHACYRVCPEAINLHDLAQGAPLSECTKCRECVAACPGQAISFPLIPSKVRVGTQVVTGGSQKQTVCETGKAEPWTSRES